MSGIASLRPLAEGARGWVRWQGRVHEVRPHPAGVQLLGGQVLHEGEFDWLPALPPLQGRRARSCFALGLNYADHARELDFKPPSEPLLFLKGANTLCGHRGQTPRPPGARHMHYECELVAVIGREARRVSRAQALDHVAGYTIANDYAVRDYLENFYRPNLRVKNRDACTPIGPWLVPAAQIGDPQGLSLRSWVNGELKQSGSTRDMVFGVAELIEYLSGFMTLSPGDLILTGTPDGVVDCPVGSEVVCEIDGLGRLHNTIIEGQP
ncbi:fumarylacetoacetate hydrolase family protein [Paucibacter sp. APW11]|uniref:Fumarylacetoacetate hydrolase family protein n=1 Tax=Roseateles aquae TaxID=3077235 RepID=A0ABU3PAI5_9BURK|nr:fumarylacetoacetate hydrolase family protein [Paucibacter sp. APW11]MDT8999589.1 fumarylacetoacetate hydrolase family protein [Paucibacter sp. APW11]